MANVIIVLVLVVIVGIALKSTRKHMKGEVLVVVAVEKSIKL